MKAKLTKKILCAVLSLLMAATSLPFAALAEDSHNHFTEDPATAKAATALHDAIENYEAKMDGTIYTNMSAAYDEYCKAVKLQDKYSYTKAKFDGSITADDLNTQAGTLDRAANAMTEWVPAENITEVRPEQEIYYSDSGYSGNQLPENESSYYNNILFAKPLPDSPTGNVTVGNANVTIRHGDTVVYYNGDDDTPIIPVAVKTEGANLYSIYPNQNATSRRDSNDISLGYQKGKLDVLDNALNDNNYWIGTDASNSDFIYNFTQFCWYKERKFVSADYTTGVKGMASSSRYQSSGYAVFNGIKVKALTNDQYSKTITPTWYVVANSNTEEGYITNDTAKIYVVNYNALTQAISRNSQKLNIGVVNTYAAGGLKDVIDKFNEAMNLDIDSYDYSTNTEQTVKDVAKAIEDKVKALDAVSSTPDPAEYQSLRDAIDSQRQRYEEHYSPELGRPEPLEDVYTNWEDFITTYEAALTAMSTAATAEKSYPSTGLEDVSSKAEALKNFLLQGEKARVDVTLLISTMDNAQYVYDNADFFNLTSDKENIKNAIDHAKTAVWGAVENYPHGKYQLEDTEENFDIVLNEAIAVANTIRDLKINPAAEVLYVKNAAGETQSLNDVRDTAKDIINNHSSDYSNSATLQATYDYTTEYLADTNNTNVLSEPGRQNYARDLVNAYKDLVVTLYDAINSLKPAFTTSIANGTIIDGGTATDTSFDLNGKNDHANYKLENFIRSTNQVIFRTTNEASDVTLGPVSMIVSTSVNNSDDEKNLRNYIDALNFNANADTWGNDNRHNTSIVTWNFAKSYTLNDTDKNNHPGNLTAAANDGASYTVKNIYVTSSNTRYGSDAQGNDAGNIEYDDYLKNTAEGVDGAGVNLYNGNTFMRANYVLSLPAVSDKECTQKTYSLDTNLGMIVRYKNRSGVSTAQGYGWNYTNYKQSTTVINIAPLLDLINEANNLVAAPDKSYTSDTLNALLEAIDKADNEFAYWDMSADNIINLINDRINDLRTAIDNLSERANFSKKVTVNADNNSYTFDYNEAKYYVFRLLNSALLESDPYYKDYYGAYYTAESVQEVADTLLNGTIADGETSTSSWVGKKKFEYLNCNSESDRYNVAASEQDKIDWEIRQFVTFAQSILKKVDLDNYKSALNSVQSLNTDAYNVNAIQEIVDQNPLPQQDVNVNGTMIVAYNQTSIDGVTQNIIEAITDKQYDYSVKVVDSDGNYYYLTDSEGNLTAANSDEGKAAFHYGDIVKVNSFDGEKADFSATLVAANTTNHSTTKKLMTTATEYQFDVRGNITVYVSSSTSSDNVKITFYDSRVPTRVIAVDYAHKDEAYDMSKAPVPSFLYYTLTDYTVKDGTNSGEGTTVSTTGNYTFTSDTKVVANYGVNGTAETNTIDLYDTSGAQVDGYPQEHGYNDDLTVTVEGAAGFIDKDTNEVIAVGDTYRFRTCQDIALKAVSELPTQDNTVTAIKVPVIEKGQNGNAGKLQLVGSFAFPNGPKKPKQFGIVLDTTNTFKDSLTLGNVNGKGVYNLSCSQILSDNQFAASVGYRGTSPFTYVAYAIYSQDGKDYTIYSSVRSYDPAQP